MENEIEGGSDGATVGCFVGDKVEENVNASTSFGQSPLHTNDEADEVEMFLNPLQDPYVERQCNSQCPVPQFRSRLSQLSFP